MRVLYKRCAGLDVHKDSVVACLRDASRRKVEYELRTFKTTTSDLFQLADWLEESGCTHAVMEATGVFWKPVWHIIAERVDTILANAKAVKNVPGRKTDVNDATWLADLLAHGLIRASFVPGRPIQQLRDLTRTRKQLVRQRTRFVQRIQKVLEDTNLKIASVISDITGVSGRRILEALITGETDPRRLVQLCDHRIRASKEELIEGLTGYFTPHHGLMIKIFLSQIDSTDTSITELEHAVDRLIEPFRPAVTLLETVPGVGQTAAHAIIAEIGTDMSRFPTANQLISWAGLSPANDVSAGRIRSNRTRHGDPWLKETLVQCAWSAIASKDSYEKALFRRVCARRGPKKAAVAVGASLLRAIYHILQREVPYKTLGPDHFTRFNPERAKKRHVKALESLGFKVQIEAA